MTSLILKDTYIENLTEQLISKRYTSIYIDGCNIGNNGAIKISNLLLHDKSIKELTIKNDCVKEDGLIALGRLLETNTTIIYFDIANITGYETGIQPIIEGMKLNRTIKTLILSNNFIYTLNYLTLSNILKRNNILEKLYLADTVSQEGLDGIRSVISSLKSNKTLELLDISNNCLNDDIIINELQSLLLVNKTLESINISKNVDITKDNVISVVHFLEQNSGRVICN